MDKTKEIVFRHPSACNFATPHIEEIIVTKFPLTYISATFTTTI